MLHTRLRPHCKEFLEKIAKLYELHVFTFGSRLYAHTIAGNGLTGLQFTEHFQYPGNNYSEIDIFVIFTDSINAFLC